jgi:hypothetical protein
MNLMRCVLEKILKMEQDKFICLVAFYRMKNKAGYGLFSTLAGESFPNGWLDAIEKGFWAEEGIYGDNFRKAFELEKS